ncbi:hypothetical protein LCY76_12240 [Fictibacillus sp. KIGAM418]|uniref:Uncharacterized protein n=1 Tax=Fictibacillus marinisediminis TaxID=2878389 RepID=A0A9X1XDE4_9BACL|nr:hypothetical protein [Fictibacillus marinisediminis]MCK6257363.1 hypothetical protein [Fictibacillus marinisediminis]
MNFTFSSCDITLPKPSLSCGKSGTGETHRRVRRGGSPHAPRKASILKRKSTTPKSNKGYENSKR